MGCPVVCGRRDKEFIIASVSKRYQNLEKKSLFFFVVGVGVLVASHFDTKIRCERFSKIEDKRESLTNTWTCVMFIALILFLSVCCLSLSLSACVSLCVRVSVRACVCAVLCVSLLLFDEFFVLFQASLVLIFLVDSSSLPMRLCVHLLRLNLRFLLSNTRTVAALSLLFFSHFPATFRRLSKRLSNDERCSRARVCPVVLVLVLVFRAQRRTNEDSRARETRCV